MEGFGSLLRLAPVALEALLGVAATAHSGFGLFSGVSFGWGHADLVCIVMRSIPDIRETMSHRVSMSHRMDENLAIMQSHKPCIMNNFHEVASGNPLSCSLIFKFGKARILDKDGLARFVMGDDRLRTRHDAAAPDDLALVHRDPTPIGNQVPIDVGEMTGLIRYQRR